MEEFFPIFLRSSNIRCLIIGAGKVAAVKAKTLLKHGIKPCLIAPEACEDMLNLIHLHKINWSQRIFMANDVKNYNMIVAATSSKVVNHLIKSQISENILFDDTSDAGNGNFIIPAVVERGSVKLAISTSGQVPFLSKEICAYLDKILPDFPKSKISDIAQIRTSIISRAGENIVLKKQLMEKELNPLIIELFKKDEL